MNLDQIANQNLKDKKVPPIKSGDVVSVVQETGEEGGAKQQIFEGVVLSVSGIGLNKMFTVRLE